MSNTRVSHADIVLIGTGIMSATLGALLRSLDPTLTLRFVERLDRVSAESSDAWNNAGTGHAALCELNYTPQKPDGSVDVSKALKINAQFEESKQFWSFLAEQGILQDPAAFIRSTPHMSFVWGDKNVDYLRTRYEALKDHHLFAGIAYSEDPATIAAWAPLLLDGRELQGPIAATFSDQGVDIDFGALTRALVAHLTQQPGVQVDMRAEVRDLERRKSGNWAVEVKHLDSDHKELIVARKVFIGAGGGSLPLLERSNIPEARGYGGFPVSGQWLRCTNPAVIARHHAKVYGKAAVGAPPMSVPHLDSRMIDGEPALLFGPFAGFSTKFLKNGSWLDLPASVKYDNIRPLLQAGWANLDLTRYLIEQVRLEPKERMAALREFMPDAQDADWELAVAGQRVQVIKKVNGRGVLEFGTELVSSADGSLSGLLGASPGASTAVSIMLTLLNKCFPERKNDSNWQAALHRVVPSYGGDLSRNAELLRSIRAKSHAVLQLEGADALA